MGRGRVWPPDIESGALSTGRGRRDGLRFVSAVSRPGMRFGNLEVRPLGGGLGCLFMVLFSVVASVVLTVLINLLLR
jgi:hypothetical protein